MDDLTRDIISDLRDEIEEKKDMIPAAARYVTCSVTGMKAILDELDTRGSKLDASTSALRAALTLLDEGMTSSAKAALREALK